MILTLILLGDVLELWINHCYMFLIFPFNGVFSQTNQKLNELPIFKGGNEWGIGNYRPISVLPCFSKMLEKMMCNRVYKHLNENDLLYKKQLGLQKAHSTEDAIIQLVDQINSSFGKNLFYWEFLLTYPKHSTLLIMRSYFPN